MITTTGTSVPITPRGEIRWESIDCESCTLYTPLYTEDSVDPLSIFRTFMEQPSNHKVLGNGGHGFVSQVAGYALKHHYSKNKVIGGGEILPDGWIPGGLPDLRANVALAEGLKSVPQIRQSDFDMRAPQIYGAFIPHDWHEGESQILWLMELLKPVKKSIREELSLPEKKTTQKAVRKSTCRCGYGPWGPQG
jgi:hypothetical protein